MIMHMIKQTLMIMHMIMQTYDNVNLYDNASDKLDEAANL